MVGQAGAAVFLFLAQAHGDFEQVSPADAGRRYFVASVTVGMVLASLITWRCGT